MRNRTRIHQLALQLQDLDRQLSNLSQQHHEAWTRIRDLETKPTHTGQTHPAATRNLSAYINRKAWEIATALTA